VNGVLEDLAMQQRARAVLRDRRSTTAARDSARQVLGLPAKRCGTRDRYVNDRCRCDACRQANTEYFHLYRGLIRQRLLRVLCWCEQSIVIVPADDVRDGRTRSCGAPGCGP
jgi:hypothetical protein